MHQECSRTAFTSVPSILVAAAFVCLFLPAAALIRVHHARLVKFTVSTNF